MAGNYFGQLEKQTSIKKTSVYCCFEYVWKSENVNSLSKKNLVQSSVKFLNDLKGYHHSFSTLSSG